MMPAPRNSAPFTNAWLSMDSASPARPSGVSSANPARNMPEWLIVENASSRLICRSRKQYSAPTTAVSTPRARKTCEIATRWPSAAPNTDQYIRAIPYRPSSTITPENITQTGVGATACASASQKWNGTIAALTSSPVMTSRNAIDEAVRRVT